MLHYHKHLSQTFQPNMDTQPSIFYMSFLLQPLNKAQWNVEIEGKITRGIENSPVFDQNSLTE